MLPGEIMNTVFHLKEAHVYGDTNSRSVQAIFGIYGIWTSFC